MGPCTCSNGATGWSESSSIIHGVLHVLERALKQKSQQGGTFIGFRPSDGVTDRQAVQSGDQVQV